VKQLVYRILYFLQVFRIISFVFCRKKIAILTYHGFSKFEHHDGLENSSYTHVFIEDFKQQIRFLKRHFTVVSLNEALEMLRSGHGFRRNPIVITIDDGYKSVFSLAFPVLREFGVPATVYCTTNFIKGGEYLWVDRLEYALNTTKEKWISLRSGNENMTISISNAEEKTKAIALIKSQLKKSDPGSIPETLKKIELDLKSSLDSTIAVPELYLPLGVSQIIEMEKSKLVSIGSHTASHAILSRCPIADIEKELKESKEFLEDSLQKPVSLFCYPNGQEGDFNELAEKLIQKYGFVCAVTTIDGMNNSKTKPYELKRYWVRSTIRTIPEFALLVNGFLGFMYRIKRNVLRFFL
jgi:peptidoglycan/xylan/chitin deacetylase (PgdA/CDA1 family)